MATSFQLIYDVFFDRVKLFVPTGSTIDTYLTDQRCEQLIIQAIGDYSLEIGDLTITYSTFSGATVTSLGTISEDLTKPYINLLGFFMYKHYLLSEIDKYSRLAKHAGRDFNIDFSGIVKSLELSRFNNSKEIENIIEKTKSWDFEE